jgi:hypothetical protein
MKAILKFLLTPIMYIITIYKHIKLFGIKHTIKRIKDYFGGRRC